MTGSNHEITEEFIHSEVARAKAYQLVILIRTERERSDKEELDRLQFEHLAHMFWLRKQGKLVLSGPLLDDTDLRGICIYTCDDLDEVERYCEEDPLIKEGYLRAEVHPWMGLPGDRLP